MDEHQRLLTCELLEPTTGEVSLSRDEFFVWLTRGFRELSGRMSFLAVQNLKVHFPVASTAWGAPREWVRAVDGVSFSLAQGETLGLVGESGCGKSTVARAIMRLVAPTAGEIFLGGKDITHLNERELRPLRRKFQMIFQDPLGSLNPRLSVGDIVGEALDIHGLAESRPARQKRVAELLKSVGLDAAYAERFPHEFSGGQRQRIGIARALAVEPELLVCDEPVSALDVSVQAQIINLLRDLQQRHGLALLFIGHDLAVVEHISHRIMVMYLGRVVESGPAREIIAAPQHPYTKALISAVPEIDSSAARARIHLQGDVPSPIHPPDGCAFHPRCPVAIARCAADRPELRVLPRGGDCACHLVGGA